MMPKASAREQTTLNPSDLRLPSSIKHPQLEENDDHNINAPGIDDQDLPDQPQASAFSLLNSPAYWSLLTSQVEMPIWPTHPTPPVPFTAPPVLTYPDFDLPVPGLTPQTSDYRDGPHPRLAGSWIYPPNLITPSTPAYPLYPPTALNTGLSPMFAGFTTASSPSSVVPTSSLVTFLDSRSRSSTLLTANSITPSTPQSSDITYPLPHPHPYSYPPSRRYTTTGPTISKRLHPAPLSPSIHNDYSRPISSSSGSGSSPIKGGMIVDGKQARFKPTKQQLAVLISVYTSNPNPDAQAREALARELGDGIRSKTLQIWFQNRRSKARAKESEGNGLKPLTLRERTLPLGRSVSGSTRVDMNALRELVHDDDPTLETIPISVLSINTWTRILTPGSGSTPDLALSISPHTSLNLYTMHQKQIYRLTIPYAPGAIKHIGIASGDGEGILGKTEKAAAVAVAVGFELARLVCRYAMWDQERDEWVRVEDFTGGVGDCGGRVEITGDREILLPAFSKIQSHLSPSPIPALSSWQYPNLFPQRSITSSSQPLSSSAIHTEPNPQLGLNRELDLSRYGHGNGLGHGRKRSMSAPILILPHAAPPVGLELGSYTGYEWGV